jgi:phenylacetate-CoA ligase
MHYWDDYLYCEIIDPKTGRLVPFGEGGELVITTLVKEGAPLIRYRTHDLTRFVEGTCACGATYPRIDMLIGRTDDMVKVKGVNLFPAQVDEIVSMVEGASSEYQVMIDHVDGRDLLTLLFETAREKETWEALEAAMTAVFKARIGFTPEARAVSLGDLPRSEKKSTRIFDNRY